MGFVLQLSNRPGLVLPPAAWPPYRARHRRPRRGQDTVVVFAAAVLLWAAVIAAGVTS